MDNGEEQTTLWAFIRSFFIRWFVAMSGPLTVPFATLAVFAPNTWQKISFSALAVGCAAFSSYWVWRVERLKKNEIAARLEDTLAQLKQAADAKKPDFRLEIHNALSAFFPEPNPHTLVLLAVSITNAGADSVVRQYRVKYDSEDLHTEPQLVTFPDQAIEIGGFRMMGRDAINHKTNVPIPRGGHAVGRLPFVVPDNRIQQVASGEASIAVTIHDYVSNSYTVTFKGTGDTGLPAYITGEPVLPPV